MIRDTVTIADAGTTATYDARGKKLLYIRPDAAYDGTGFKFHLTDNGTDWEPIQASGTDYVVLANASTFAMVPTLDLPCLEVFRLVSNAAQSGAASVITLYFAE